MAQRTRVKGKDLTIKINSVEYNLDIKSINYANEEADGEDPTFAELAQGGSRTHYLEITAIYTYETGNLWNYLWSNVGLDVPFVLTTAAGKAGAVILSGTLTLPAEPALNFTAGETSEFEIRANIVGKPVKTLVTV